MLRLIVAVFYEEYKALTVTVRALNKVYFKNNLWIFALSSYTKILIYNFNFTGKDAERL